MGAGTGVAGAGDSCSRRQIRHSQNPKETSLHLEHIASVGSFEHVVLRHGSHICLGGCREQTNRFFHSETSLRDLGLERGAQRRIRLLIVLAGRGDLTSSEECSLICDEMALYIYIWIKHEL